MARLAFLLSRVRARAARKSFWLQLSLMGLGVLQVSNCTSVQRADLTPASPMLEPPAPEVDEAAQDAVLAIAARDVLDKRCVGCHGCYDAPCQLKLTNAEGLERGGTKLLVYDGARARAMPPTRLGIDAQGVDAWRTMGFHSVLGLPKEHPSGSPILKRMLDLKKKHPLPAGIYLPADMEVGIDREHTCPNWEEMEAYEREHPAWGMPYALPGLSEKEDKALRDWLDAGAPILAPKPLPKKLHAEVDAVEAWLNQQSPVRKLVAQYIYEHLFLATLHFEGQGSEPARWFRLVRSKTPSGKPVKEYATRLSIDPVQGPRYYRLVERDETVLSKTHLTYAIGPKRLERWNTLFAGTQLAKANAPDQSLDARSNPFRTFAGIPMAARYKFLLDDAGFFLGGFIKGPVCRGQTALNVIQDRFWVFFLNPDSQVSEDMSRFLQEVHDDLNLPAEDGSQNSLMRWIEYATQHERYLEKKKEFVEREGKRVDRPESPLWRGDGSNPNAALTVFRHHDSATVVQGLVGANPKTAWLLSYPELERIHYLLVAGFDVFGNIGHQVNTRLYMDFLRMEGEYNFLLLVGKKERQALVKWWYRDVGGLKEYWIAEQMGKTQLEAPWVRKGISTAAQVYAKLKETLAPIDRGERFNLADASDPMLKTLRKVNAASPQAATHFPELTLLMVQGKETQLFSLLRETAFANVARLLLDKERRRPQEDKLSIFKGVLGSYPNAILRVQPAQLPELVQAIKAVKSESDYAKLLSRFGVRRTNPEFWAVSDEIHRAFAKMDPLEYGRLDYNRLENR